MMELRIPPLPAMILRRLPLLKHALRLGGANAKVKTMPSIGSLIYSGVIPLVKM